MTGQLGYGSTEAIGDDEAPASAGDVPVGGRAVSVAVGYGHTCAVMDNGRVRCWGLGYNGALGHGNVEQIGDDEPASAGNELSLGAKALQVEAGAYHTCALLETGDVRCWGDGGVGQLGLPSSVVPGDTGDFVVGDDEVPSDVPTVFSGGPVQAIALGDHHTCVLRTDAKVRCWGYGGYGALGYANTDSVTDAAAASDVDVGGEVVQLSAGTDRTCAVLRGGGVRCWGWGHQGALGYGNGQNVGDDETPASAGDVPLGAPALQVATGAYHTCALLQNHAVRCWGQRAMLANHVLEDVGDDETPDKVPDVELGGRAIAISAGVNQTCALLESGAVRCWGWSPGNGYATGDLVGDVETPASLGDVQVLDP